MPDAPPPMPPAHPTEEPDLLPPGACCMRCGYPLQGLIPASLCPECGTPARESIRGAWLRFAAPEFLHALRTGTLCVQIGVAASLVAFFAGDILQSSIPGTASTVFSAFFSAAIIVLTVIGYWLFTHPEPALEQREKSTSARRILRTAAITYGVATLISTLDKMLSAAGTATPLSMAWNPLVSVSKLVLILAWAFVFFSAMLYIRWLARRIPDPALVQRSKTYMWVLPVLMVPLYCTCVGPLIAVILYIVHLGDIRKAASQSLEFQRAAALEPRAEARG